MQGSIKVHKIEDPSANSDIEAKSIRQLQIHHQIRNSDLEDQHRDP